MSITLKPYPEYKESGVPWIGKVPRHWHVVRLGSLLKERGETNDDSRVTAVLSVLKGKGVIPYADKGNIGNKASEDITRYKVVRPDDIVVNCMNVIIGSVGISKYTGCLSPVYYVLRRRRDTDDPQYLNAYFQTKPFQQSLVRIGNGILAHRMRIPMELLKCEPFPHPPSDEQTSIVTFLDYLDRIVKRLIRAKRREIELLQDERRAIIQTAISRGVDGYVALKPSGLSRLGDIPDHWQMRRIASFSTKITNGWVGPTRDILCDSGTPYIQSLHVKHNSIRFAKPYFVSPSWLAEHSKVKLKTGDVVIVQTGDVGQVAYIPKEYDGAGCHALIIVSTNSQVVTGEFLAAVLSSRFGADSLKRIETGALLPHLNCTHVRDVVVPCPPVPEQQRIVSEIKAQCQFVDAGIDRTEREIELVREYRTRLIADVVTGKLDVRGVEVPELEGVEGLEGLSSDEAGDLEGEDEEMVAAVENEDAAN